MSLLSDAKKAVAPAQAEAKPVQKKSNSEYQKKARERAFKAANAIRDYLTEKKIELPANLKEELSFLCKDKKASNSSIGGKPVIYKIFGNTPKVGDKVTALKIFEESGKGFAEMRQMMKKWAAQNIIVEFDAASKSYVIKSGTIEAYVEA